jgi:diguanylate cyclase (GGDEF)-like protein
LTGRRLADFFPDVDVLGHALNAPAKRHWIETGIRLSDGEALTVALSVAGLHSNSAAPGAVVLVQDITERKRSEERLIYLARYDALTGLPNRTLLMDHLGQALSRTPWKKGHTGILFCDLDRFKFVNDTLGHSVGDLLLQRVAERLQRCVRPGDIVARWSGDEFVVLLNDVAKPTDIEPIAEKVVAELSRPNQVGPHELYVTASVGISFAPTHACHAEELVKCADMAMYAAKAEGKNMYRFYTTGMAERSQERMQLERALRRALQEGGQLQVHYQPQQRIDGPLIGFEALVRWQHPELGMIAPANFLPAAEEAGLMAGIDEAVLRIACAQARDWQQQGFAGLRIAVNVSDHLFQRGDLPVLLGSLLGEYALPPSAIELELTEAIVMSDIESAIGTMRRVRALGVDMSIDDFGTGYSSLAHLKRCPIQMLKIDRSFVNDVMTDPSDAAITEAITALAHKMSIQVIAEGVETQAQLDALRRYGCDAIQGYFLSKPLPPDLLPEFLARFDRRATPVAACAAS